MARARTKEYVDLKLEDKDMRKLRKHKRVFKHIKGRHYCILRADGIKERKIAKYKAMIAELRKGE